MNLLKVLFLVAGFCIPFTGMYAQTKKTGTKATTTTTAKRSTAAGAKKSTAGAALTKQKIAGSTYLGFISMSLGDVLGKNSGILTVLGFSGEEAKLDLMGNVLKGPWSLTGNSMTVNADHLKFKVSSVNGGKTLTGNDQKMGKIYLQKFKVEAMSSEAFKKAFNGGKYSFYVIFESSKINIGCKATVKFTPNSDGLGGTYKVVADNDFLTSIGVLKGDYTFTEKGIEFTSRLTDGTMAAYQNVYFDNDKSKVELDGPSTFMTVNLGPSNIADYGGGEVCLYMMMD